MVLEGAARKISLVLTVISVLGLVIFTVGFGLRIHRLTKVNVKSEITFTYDYSTSDTDISPTHREFFPYWLFLVSGVLLYVVYFIHHCANHGVTQCITIFLMVPYFIGAGGILYMNGLFISTAVEMLGGIRLGDDSDGSDDSDGGIGDYYWFVVEFAGCILSMLLLWISLMLWPCFQKNKYRGYYEY